MGTRTYADVPRVYFDFDDTLLGFSVAAAKRGMTPKEFKVQPGAYRDLEPLPGALAAIERAVALGLDPFGLTKIPQANPHAATEKLLCVVEKLPMLHDKVIIAPDKGAVGTWRDFLVDDKPEWANAHNFAGTVIRFEGEWDPVFDVIEKKLAQFKMAAEEHVHKLVNQRRIREDIVQLLIDRGYFEARQGHLHVTPAGHALLTRKSGS